MNLDAPIEFGFRIAVTSTIRCNRELSRQRRPRLGTARTLSLHSQNCSGFTAPFHHRLGRILPTWLLAVLLGGTGVALASDAVRGESVPHPAPAGANNRCVMSTLTHILYEIAPGTASVVTMWPFGQTAIVRPCDLHMQGPTFSRRRRQLGVVGCQEAAGRQRLVMADSASTRSRLRPDFRRAISPGQCRLSALSANWRCRPIPDIGERRLPSTRERAFRCMEAVTGRHQRHHGGTDPTCRTTVRARSLAAAVDLSLCEGSHPGPSVWLV